MRNSIFHKTQDFLTIIRGTWFIQLLNITAALAFLMLSQGEDILLLISEHTRDGQVSGCLMLLAGLLFWSISSEYGTRMLIYLTDNSGRALDPARVDNRKRYQLLLSRIALFFPVAVILCAFVKVSAFNWKELTGGGSGQFGNAFFGILIIMLALLLEGVLLWYLYPGNLVVRLSKRYPCLAWLSISPRENEWVTKLYGILNDVRVDIPVYDERYSERDLPRETPLPDGMVLPESHDFVASSDNPILAVGNVKVWMFHIRVRFYRCLLRQLIVLLVISLVVIASVGLFLPASSAASIGSAAIICLAFGCWQVVYVCLHFLDKAQPVPVRFLLVVWMVICGLINNDHPVRVIPGTAKAGLTLHDHFETWFKNAKTDELRPYWYRVNNGKAGDIRPANDSVPVIFVSAEGGALRTGAFTGLMLARLERRFELFKNYLYCYSSVSGGTVGVNFFNAQLLRNRDSSYKKQYWFPPAKKFFETDFLSAVVAKLMFGEVVNCCLPIHLECTDRAVALEKGFEYGWEKAYPGDNNLFCGPFDQTMLTDMPAVFINTTECETGLQQVWSNVGLSTLPLSSYRDLRQNTVAGLAYSSAINLSDRFPLVSPGAAMPFMGKDHIGGDSTFKRHFVDGGYYENKGSETLLQVLMALPLEGKKIKPLLQFNFGGDTTIKSISKGNEVLEIFDGLYNTRGGRGQVAQDALEKYVRSLHGIFIPVNLTLSEKSLPMNWVLSESVIKKLDGIIKELVDAKTQPDGLDTADRGQLKKLFLYDPNSMRRRKR